MKIETTTIRRLSEALLQSGRRPTSVLSSAYETLTRTGLLTPEETVALTRVDPVAETMFLMMAADGTIKDPERDAVRGAIRGLTGDVLRSGTINVMLENYEKALREQGREARLRDIANDLADEPGEAEVAFALAAAVAVADGAIATEEDQLIKQLAEWFEISETRANSILDQLEEDRTPTRK
jgi:tellurite resistance protein